MRYTIPTRKEDREKERNRILHAAASDKELHRIKQALDWMMGCADGTIRYSDRNYRKLYDICKNLGITGGKKESAMYPVDGRNEADFKQELDHVWRTLQVYAQEKTPSLLDSYRKYMKNRNEYDAAFRAHDENLKKQRRDEGMPEPDPMDDDLPMALEEEEEAASGPLLADEKSPYAHLIKGSVYSELYDLYKGMKPQLRPGRHLSDRLFQESMDQLLSNMQLHYLRRNGMGNMLPMTKNERREITELYHNCLRDGQKLSDKLKKKPQYKKLHSLLAKNEQELRHLPKGEFPPLADVIRGQSTPTIHLVAQEKETIGMASSSREAVEYTDAEGNIRRGFFTAERKLGNADAELDGIVDKYERQYPKYSDYFKKIKSIKNELEFKRMLYDTLDHHVFGRKMIVDPVKRYFREEDWISGEDKRDKTFVNKVLIPMITEMARSFNMQGILRKSGFESKDLLAERAGAMADVARFLGYPNLLVGTQNVTVKRGDRTETGVMMEPADMDLVDPAKITNGHPFYNLKSTDFDKREFLSSVADLQILDYLCANTDRHGNNFFLKMDLKDPEKPKLLGVQGIDNDNSFGGLNEGGILKLAKGSNLKIITPKMAAAVSAMTQEQFRDILKPYHLSGAEMEAARERLMDLQDMIKEGKKRKDSPFTLKEGKYDLVNREGAIHVMKKDEWDKLTLQTLLPKDVEEKNLFKFANIHRKLLVEKENREQQYQNLLNNLKNTEDQEIRKEHLKIWNGIYSDRKVDAEGNFLEPVKIEKEPEPLRYTKQADQVDYQKLAEMQEKELADLKKMRDQFNAAHGSRTDVNRSKKFKAMRAALTDLINQYEEFSRLDLNEDLISGVSKEKREKNRDKNMLECYKQIEEKRQILKQAVDTYLDIFHWKLRPSENNQKRIDTAKQLSGLIREAAASGQYYKSSKALQDVKINKAKEDQFAQGRYISNEIHTMMTLTLRDNVNALKTNDPLRKKGILAMQAHERLWNYSQSAVSNEPVSMKKSGRSEKEKISWKELMKAANKEKEGALPDENQIRKDLNIIKEYAEGAGFNFGPSIDGILNDKDGIQPRRIGGVLNNLFVSGSQMAKERKEAAKTDAIQHANDINTGMKQPKP